MTLKSELLKGKTAVITGCMKGIGRATMELFAQNGADIIACCQFDSQEFLADIGFLSKTTGTTITPVVFDLSDSEQIKNAAKIINSSKKRIDILVNIAGMTQDAVFHMISMEQMKKIFEINFFSQMLLTQYITKLMLRNKKGSVINIVSIAGLDGNPGQLSYSASKGALIAATKTLSAELAPQGIRVNAIAPGVIKTDMTEHLQRETFLRFMDKSSLKHIGLPNEVAGAIVFLASDLSSYITGQVLRVDGGIG